MYKVEDVLLKVENVSLSYDRLILRDIQLEICDVTRTGLVQGQVVSLVGRSGIGKTQLFRILSGLIQPDAGTVKIGKDQHPVKAGEVGIVPQNYILFNHRSIKENLKIGLRNAVDKNKYSEKDKEDLIHDYANRFDLKDHLTKYPMELSGGQRQRVSIIQQILTGNEFILLDEPFSGLDNPMKDKVIELLLSISTLDELKTLVIISHDIESSLAISDTAFLLGNEPNKQGATIIEKVDLMQLNFAWNPDVKKSKAFQDLVLELKYKI